MHDLWTLRGVGIKPEQFPMILGCDGAGTLDDGTEVVLHSRDRRPELVRRRDARPEADAAHREAPGHVRRLRDRPGPQRAAQARRAVVRRGGVHGHGVADRVPDAVREVRPAPRPDDARAGRVGRRVDRADPARPRRRDTASGSPGAPRRSARWPTTLGAHDDVRVRRAAARAGRRGVRDRRQGHLVALDEVAEARRHRGDLRRDQRRTPTRPSCSGCSSCSCAWSARPWAPARSWATCSRSARLQRHQAADRRRADVRATPSRA